MKTKLGGTLVSIKDSNGKELLDSPAHNRIVNSGMMSLLKVPEANASWYASKASGFTVQNASYPSQTLVAPQYGICDSKIFWPSFGIGALLQCGTSNAATSDDMTSLVEPVTSTDLSCYGAAYNSTTSKSVKLKVTHGLSGSNYVEKYKMTYLYIPKSDFICKEIGLFTPYPTALLSSSDYVEQANLGMDMFARIVLPKTIELQSGTLYTFTYVLTFTKKYSTDWEQHDDIWGFPAVMRRRYDIISTSSDMTTESLGYRCGFSESNPTRLETFNQSSPMLGKVFPSMALNYGACFQYNQDDSYPNDRCGGVFSAPTIYWCTTLDGTYSSSVATYATSVGKKDYRASGSIAIKYGPDEIIQNGDTFRARTTYRYDRPYSDTSSRYPAIQFGNYVWLVNATWQSASSITGDPIGLDNLHRFTVTMDTVLERI